MQEPSTALARSWPGEAAQADEVRQPRAFVVTEHAALPLGERAEWRLAERIAASRGFHKSELLQRFLLEICERTLTGQARSITEQYIGIRIFGRPEGYDPGEDNIVRSYARMLRKRLDAYFDGEGAAEPMRLDVPRGGYVPVFAARMHAAAAQDEARARQAEALAAHNEAEAEEAIERIAPAMAATDARETGGRWKWAACGALAGALLMLAAWAAVYGVQMFRQRPVAHALWTELFQKDRTTLIVPADSGLGIVENLTGTQATLDGYANGTYLAGLRAPAGMNAGSMNDLTRQRYTSAADLTLGEALAALPEYRRALTETRFPRNLTPDELRNANVILLGSARSNPWVRLFEPRLNFQCVYTERVDVSYIVNRHPQAGEQAQYTNGAADGRAPTYGVVAYLPDAGGAGHVLLVEGLNMAATEAAGEILFDAASIGPVLRAAAGPGGRLRAFEVLVETTSVNASAPAARVLATRVYP